MRLLLTFMFVLSSLFLSAQLNDRHIYLNEKVDELSSVEIQSKIFPPNVTNNGLPGSGYDSLSVEPVTGSPNTYTVNFEPPNGFMGDTEIRIEYFETGAIPGIPYPNYITLHYRIKASKITTQDDYVLAAGNSVSVMAADNDDSTNGDLTITRLGYVSGGTASITNGDQIDFTFDSGSSIGRIVYFIEDTLGTMASAFTNVMKEDDQQVSSLNVALNNKESQILELPSADYTPSVNPTHGTLSSGPASHIWMYTPDAGYTGGDQVVFTTAAGGDIEYTILVVDKSINNSFVIDDEDFCETNGSITFNVFDNDMRSDFNIYDYSPELTYNGNGEFSYSPPTDFKGDATFYYKVFSGIQFHEGNILIHVDDFEPSDEYNYSFEILNNHPIKILHQSPIGSYEFSIVTPPLNGTLTVLDANGEIVDECAVIEGNNTIFYEPDIDYTGVDEFDLEYCTLSNNCEIVKVDIDVLDSNYEECLCLNECVYLGDNNDDGIVNSKDVLDLGLNFGIGGPERTNDFTLLWTGQESADWGYQQMGSGIDLKCGDADGDGYIDIADLSSIDTHYGKGHKLMSSPTAAISTVPIEFIPQQTQVDSGELLVLDISIGSFANPAIDIFGAAFSFTIDADLIDSSSVVFELYDNNWVGDDNAPVIEYFKVPQDGQVDIAFSRVSSVPANGLGIVGKLEFIVEDVIIGFKDIEQLLTDMNIKMNNIISVNQFGEYMYHPDQEATIRLNREKPLSQVDISSYISTYPNPTADILYVDSDKYGIDRIEVIDALGRTIQIHEDTQRHDYVLDLTAVQEGMYFIKVFSLNQFTTYKVFKANR